MSVEAEVQATGAAPSSVDPSPEEASGAKLGLSFLTTLCYPREKTDPGCPKDRGNSVADYGSILWPFGEPGLLPAPEATQVRSSDNQTDSLQDGAQSYNEPSSFLP